MCRQLKQSNVDVTDGTASLCKHFLISSPSGLSTDGG